jgi:hypothetical protein
VCNSNHLDTSQRDVEVHVLVYKESDRITRDRKQNLNLCKYRHFCGDWMVREVYQQSTGNEELAFLIQATVSSEEEHYCCNNTAVWSSELCNAEQVRTDGEICYTSESSIQFTFFCTKNFLGTSY